MTNIAQSLDCIPAQWQLTPLGRRDPQTGEINPKAPYLSNWQNTDRDREFIATELKSGTAVGIGLRLGEPSGYVVAIDFDGQSAIDFWTEKFGEIPHTVKWTSGKDGRYQALFQVPEAHWDKVETKKITTGNGEQLEFRYTGNQSVLPPSPHPETEGYVWLNSPNDTPIADLPKQVLDYWLELIEPKRRERTTPRPQTPSPESSTSIPPIPLENCLAKSNRDLLNGVGKGSRNDAGTALSRDLIGTAEYLQLEGIEFDGDPEDLFDRFARGCSPPLSHKESDTIWQSAQKSNPTPACQDDGVKNIIKGWRKRHTPKVKAKRNGSSGKKAKPKEERRSKQALTDDAKANYERLAAILGIKIEYTEEGDIASRLNKLKMDLFDMFGDRLKLNLMTGDYELDGGHVDINNAKSFISDRLGWDYSTENCILAIHAIASRHAYHPVKQYLESLRGKVAADFDILNNIAGLFLGNSDSLANKMMAKTLIGAVARVMKPGTKVDTLTVLQGEQGFMKSTFLRVLGGADWFCDDIRDLENKDELAKLVRYWIIELAEVDYLMGRKEVESFKRFLSTTSDTYRPPYGRTNIRHDRTCALFATTNKIEFLKDPTGNRRYWVIKVGVKIDCDLVVKFRDIIWTTALAAYERGDTWWLDDTDELARAEGSEEFREPDAWEETIASQWNKLKIANHNGCDRVEIDQIFDLLDIDNAQRNKPNRNRIASILKQWGFESKSINTDNGKVRTWLKPKSGRDSNPLELSKIKNLKSKVLDKYDFLSSSVNVTKSAIGLKVELNSELDISCSPPVEVTQSSLQQAKEMELDLEPKFDNLALNYKNIFQSSGADVEGSPVPSQVPVITHSQSQFHAKQNTTSPVLEHESGSTSNESIEPALALLEPKNSRKSRFEIGEKNTHFDVGDRVRYLGDDRIFLDRVGTIEDTNEASQKYQVNWGNDYSGRTWFEESELEVAA